MRLCTALRWLSSSGHPGAKPENTWDVLPARAHGLIFMGQAHHTRTGD